MADKKTKKKKVLILKHRKPAKLTINEIVALWKSYGIELFNETVEKLTMDNLKVRLQKYSKDKLKILISLIDKAYIELNVRFVKAVDGKAALPEIDLTKIKENKQIYDAFVRMRDEHIYYFKRYPKYVYEKVSEHLEESKNMVEFDAQKLANVLDLTESMSRRHAAFIARDQLGKFSGAINLAQAEYIGAKKYIWRTSMDNRVRERHREREGQMFYYNRPPEGGNPGMDYRCRCEDEAIIEL